MNDGARLFRSILEAPGDDLARLVYADWLEEDEQEARAEFIRAQCELAGVPPEPEQRPSCRLRGAAAVRWAGSHLNRCKWCQWETKVRPRRDELRTRERELFNADWLPDCGGALREWYFGRRPAGALIDRPFSFEVRRGFAASASLTLADFYGTSGEGCGPRLVLAAPLEEVRLTDRAPVGWEMIGDNSPRLSLHDWEDTAETPSWLPTPIFRLLQGHTPDSTERTRRHLSQCAAGTALSVACVRWARAAAGLSAIPAGAAP